MDNKCESKKIIRVLVKTVDDEEIIGFVCLQDVHDGAGPYELCINEEPIVVFQRNEPNTGIAEQVGYETRTFSREQIKSITRHSEVDPEIESI